MFFEDEALDTRIRLELNSSNLILWRNHLVIASFFKRYFFASAIFDFFSTAIYKASLLLALVCMKHNRYLFLENRIFKFQWLFLFLFVKRKFSILTLSKHLQLYGQRLRE